MDRFISTEDDEGGIVVARSIGRIFVRAFLQRFRRIR